MKLFQPATYCPTLHCRGSINVRLDRLRVYEYPKPLINFGENIHTILFTFEARNQVAGSSEPVAFNQTYEARSWAGSSGPR